LLKKTSGRPIKSICLIFLNKHYKKHNSNPKAKKGITYDNFLVSYARTVGCSVFALLYAGQSAVLLHELKPNANKNTTAAITEIFFMTCSFSYFFLFINFFYLSD
jgi:hypothetical protein